MADPFLVTQLVDEIERTSLTGKWETGGTPGLHWARACLQWELKEAQQWFLGVGAVWIKLLSAEWLLHCTGSSVLFLECFVAGILLSSYCRNNDINPISSGGCASGRCTSNKMCSIPPLTASQQPLWPGRVPPPHIQCKSGAEIKVHFGTDHQKGLESSPKRVTVRLQCVWALVTGSLLVARWLSGAKGWTSALCLPVSGNLKWSCSTYINNFLQ